MTRRPAWHTAALAQRPRLHDVRSDGLTLRVRAWGDAERPSMVLIHGGAAHAGWWDHLGPLLASRHHVLAPDLSGHGDSGWRDRYSLTRWSREIGEVIESLASGPPLLVGHSMGGHVGLRLALDQVAPLSGLILVDSPFHRPGARVSRPALAPRRTYPSREAAIARFRTLPSDTSKEPYVVEHVAAESVLHVGGGWTWKFDPAFVDHDLLGLDDLAPIDHCPVLVVRGEHGLVDAEMADAVSAALGQAHPPATIRDAGHHVPLDAPLALAATVTERARSWLADDTPTARTHR